MALARFLAIAIFMAAFTPVANADIYKCQDLKNLVFVFSSRACDVHTQRFISMLTQADLNKRWSTLDSMSPPKNPANQLQENPVTTIESKKSFARGASGNKNYCILVRLQKKNIQQRMQAGSSITESEFYKTRLRELSDRLVSNQCNASGADKSATN